MNTTANRLKHRYISPAGYLGRLAIALSALLLLCGGDSAQYGGATGTGTTTGTGTGTSPSNPSYGSNGKAIGIGVGAAAGGAAALYLALHHRSSVGGCVSEANDRLSFTEAKTGKTYALMSDSADVKAGERVELRGKKSINAEGAPTFEVKKVVKDLGSCR